MNPPLALCILSSPSSRAVTERRFDVRWGPRSREGVDPWGSMTGDEDTIAAVATPVVPQEGGVAIVRLSGGDSVDIVRRLFMPTGKGKARGDWQPESHKAVHGCMLGATRDEVLDEVRSFLEKSCALQVPTREEHESSSVRGKFMSPPGIRRYDH